MARDVQGGSYLFQSSHGIFSKSTCWLCDIEYCSYKTIFKCTFNFLFVCLFFICNHYCCFILNDCISGGEGNKISIKIQFGRIKPVQMTNIKGQQCFLTNIFSMKLSLNVSYDGEINKCSLSKPSFCLSCSCRISCNLRRCS